ncbi:helix-turn-helix transcriptional regulator [Mycoplasmatota bacterium]|nr:helix-turn-helix transcriptional regulator [Mycoplasmatota bacterium]
MDYQKIGTFIKELRMENKLTQKEVADILIVTPQTISKWELGQSLPSIDLLQSLSQIYHVTVDEIINCKINESNQRNKSRFDSRNILSYIIYLLLLTIGITICFVNYLAIDSRILDYGLNSYPFEGIYNFTQVSVKLSNWLVIIFTIFLPVLLATLHVLDKRKKFLLSITILAILLLITFQVPIIASPGFITAEIGLMLHFIYTLFLILSTIINLSYFNIDVYWLINKNKKEFISSTVMFLLTIILPFNYYNGFNYFGVFEQILFFFMLLAPCIIIYETVNGLKRFATLYYVILGISLIFSSLVNIFNSEILIGSFIQLIYILFLVIPNFKENRLNINLKNLMTSNFLYIEIISLVVYLYYYINPGDLFFSIKSADIIFITNTSVGKFFHLNIIILLLAMILSVANLRIMTKIFDIMWILWVTYFTQSILFDYVLNPNYKTTDGIYLFIPPILIILFFIFYLVLPKNKTKLTENMNLE